MAGKHSSRSVHKSILAGAISGTCSCLLFQPLDLVKTRIQAPTAAYEGHGMISTFYTVVRQDSVTGLWRGVTPTMSKTVPGVGLYFGTLHWLKGFFKSEPTRLQNMVLGFSSRVIAGVSLLPVSVVKTRYESGQFHYSGIGNALVSIWKKEGMRGLFSGCAATVARDAPFSGLYLMFFNEAKKVTRKATGLEQLGPYNHLICGIVAGVLASGVTQPADVVKTQLQLYPFRYNGTFQCIVLIVKNQGLQGLFKGMLPRCIRRTLMAALSWTVYEEIMKVLKLKV